MPFNGSGTFNLVYDWPNDAANGIKILAQRMQDQEQDMATNGFGNCITRDGQGVPTADISWGTHKITNLANGSATTDAAAYGQITSSLGSLQGFIGGLQLSAAGGSGIVGIAAGTASDSTSAALLTLASAFTKTTASWVAGTGNGGLDTGSLAANTVYYFYVIGVVGTPGDIVFSTSNSSPALPIGYTLFRNIGFALTDGSSYWVAMTVFQTTQNGIMVAETASNTAALVFSVNGGFSEYDFIMGNLIPVTGNAHLIMQFSEDGGATWKATNYSWGISGINAATAGAYLNANVSDTSARLAQGVSTSANRGVCGTATIINPGLGGIETNYVSNVSYTDNATANPVAASGGGFYYNDTNAITAIKFFYSSGNIASGQINMYAR